MRRKSLCAATALVVLLAAGCGRTANEAATTVAREPVNSTTNPFMEPIGTDQPNVTPPAVAGGTVSGDTAGLYGGTLDQASCDPDKMVAFLNQHPDRAAGWASVLGISTADIATYVAELTPTVLRSDTYVINHGFDKGQVTTVPAVLQAGTAVLVDVYGFPVTKCFCGNPLQRPTSFDRVVYTGPSWNTFVTTNVTVVQASTVVINQFTLVDTADDKAFDRPRGTDGHKDGPPTGLPVQAPPTGPSGHSPSGSPSGRPWAGPPAGGPGSPGSPGQGQRSASPGSPGQGQGGASPGSPGQGQGQGGASPSQGGASPGSPGQGQGQGGASPSQGGASPGSSVIPAPSASSGTSPSRGPSPSSSTKGATTNASWVVGNCYADASRTLHATVLVRDNDTTGEQTYEVTVRFGSHGDVTTSLADVAAGKTAEAKVELPSGDAGLTPNATVPCSISKIVASNGQPPVQGPALPPPPDDRPAAPTTQPTTPPTTQPPTTEAPPGEPSTPSVIPAPS